VIFGLVAALGFGLADFEGAIAGRRIGSLWTVILGQTLSAVVMTAIFAASDQSLAVLTPFVLIIALNGRELFESRSIELNASPLGSTPTCLSVSSSPHSSSAIWKAKGLHMDWMVNSLSQSPARKTWPSTVAMQIPKCFGSALPNSGM